MRASFVLSVWLVAGLASGPAGAAVNLLERFEEKGIISGEERQELEKEEAPARLVRGDGLAWKSRDGRFGSQLYGYGQVRYTFTDRDGAENSSSFSVQRVRLGLKGHALHKNLKYRLYLNVYSGNEKATDLLDYYVDYLPSKAFGIRAGSFKVPYADQWTTSAAKLQLVERTAVDGNFRLDRDTGLMVHGTLFGRMLGYEAGVFNGEGRNNNNSGDGHLFVGRVRLEPLGKYPGEEPDQGRSDSPSLRLTGAVAFNDEVSSHSRKNLNGRLEDLGASDVLGYTGFIGLKYRGASLSSEVHRRKIDPEGPAADETAEGLYIQGGYLAWGELVEVALRYEFFDPNVDVSDDLRQEYGGGCNLYIAGHRHKIQADFFRVNSQMAGTGSTDDNRFRVQYQLSF